jgi:hypothetical protein
VTYEELIQVFRKGGFVVDCSTPDERADVLQLLKEFGLNIQWRDAYFRGGTEYEDRQYLSPGVFGDHVACYHDTRSLPNHYKYADVAPWIDSFSDMSVVNVPDEREFADMLSDMFAEEVSQ